MIRGSGTFPPLARRDRLLAEILAAPDDPGPRRVLADLLLEDGDPRGELVALQCAESPTETQRKRSLALLRQHWQAWAGSLALIADPRTVRFVGGFLHSVSLRRSPPWLQDQVRPEPEHGLVRHVEVVREFTPEEAPLTRVLPRLRGLRTLLGLDADEALSVLADPPALEELGIQELDAVVLQRLLAAELPALTSIRVDAHDRVDHVLALIRRHRGIARVAVGRGDLARWREALVGRGLARVDVRVPGWVLSLGGDDLRHLDCWPVPEALEDPTEPLQDALIGLPIRALEMIHVRGGRAPRGERVRAVRTSARGTPLLLPASWRRA